MKHLAILFTIFFLFISCQPKSKINVTPQQTHQIVEISSTKRVLPQHDLKKLRKRALLVLLKTRESRGKLSFLEVSRTMKKAQIPIAQMVPTLLTGLKSDDAIIRENSEKALKDLDKISIIYLIDALDDPELQEGAALSLGNLGELAFSSKNPLIKLIKSPVSSVRFAALTALMEIAPNDEDVKSVIKNCVKDPDPEISVIALAGSENIVKKKDMNAIMVQKLIFSPLVVKSSVLYLLSEMNKKTGFALPQMIKNLFSNDFMLRYMSAKSMEKAGEYNAIAIKALRKAKHDKVSIVKEQAAKSISAIYRIR